LTSHLYLGAVTFTIAKGGIYTSSLQVPLNNGLVQLIFFKRTVNLVLRLIFGGGSIPFSQALFSSSEDG
jgi:hypothetical protein